jgi:hypothetical protein
MLAPACGCVQIQLWLASLPGMLHVPVGQVHELASVLRNGGVLTTVLSSLWDIPLRDRVRLFIPLFADVYDRDGRASRDAVLAFSSALALYAWK